MKKILTLLCLLVTLALLTRMQVPAQAAPVEAQEYVTPTAQPDGRILYTVQAGDTCMRIALLNGISVDYLRVTNQLNENCDIREGQQLLIGVGGPAAASPTPGNTATPGLPTPSPTQGPTGSATVCVLMYVDENGDGIRQVTEFGLDGGAVNLLSANGQYSQTLNTSSGRDPDDAEEPLRTCFDDLEPGAYTLSAGIPEGYNPTTVLNTTLLLTVGDTTYVNFGAQVKTTSGESGEKKTSPILGFLGGAFLLGGLGIGIYAWSTLRKKK